MASTSSILAAIASAAGLVSFTRFGVQFFPASGTFTMPSGVASVTAAGFIIGGGGGGQSGRGNNGDTTTNNGTAGGNSTFDAVTATGGSPGGTGTTGQNMPQPITPSGLAQPTTTALTWGLETDGGPGMFGFGYGGKGGVPYITQAAGTTYPRSVAAGYSGEIKSIFQSVTTNTAVTIGDGGAGGAEIVHSAGSGGGSAGQKGGKGFAAIFYWW